MIAAGVGNDSATAFVGGERGYFVVSSAEFKGADGLLVFEFEEEFALIGGACPFEQGGARGDASEDSLGGENVV
jgi:hypothetical protein